MKFELELIEHQHKGKPAVYLVRNEQKVIIGMLEKYRNNRHESHPWKAYAGHGVERKYLGAVYEGYGVEHAKKQAVRAILERKVIEQGLGRFS